MARTRGIMRKSTGGKVPRRQRAEPETQAPAAVNTPPVIETQGVKLESEERQRAEPETQAVRLGQAPAAVNTPPAIETQGVKLESEEELLDRPEEEQIADQDGGVADISDRANDSRILSEMAWPDNQDVKSESSEEDTDQAAPKTTLSNARTQELCKQLEDGCMERWDGEPLLELVGLLREFRGHLSSRHTDAEFQDITY